MTEPCRFRNVFVRQLDPFLADLPKTSNVVSILKEARAKGWDGMASETVYEHGFRVIVDDRPAFPPATSEVSR